MSFRVAFASNGGQTADMETFTSDATTPPLEDQIRRMTPVAAPPGEDQEGSDLDLLIDPAPTTTRFTLAALQRSRFRMRTRGRDARV